MYKQVPTALIHIMSYQMPDGRYVELEDLSIGQLIDLYRELKPIQNPNLHAPEHVMLHIARKLFLYHLRPYQIDQVLSYATVN